MASRFAIVGFDLDGTLVDSSRDLADAVNVALAEAGRDPLTPEAVLPMIGRGAKEMLRRTLEATGGCDAHAFRDHYRTMLAHYEANLAVHTRPYPGCVAALDALAADGARLAVVTNKFEVFARILLDKLGLTERFATIIGGDTLGPGNAKPSPAPIREMIARAGGGRAVFVGDSIYDMDAARAAGVPTIAAAYGFLTGPVADLGADAVIDHMDDLVPTIARLAAT